MQISPPHSRLRGCVPGPSAQHGKTGSASGTDEGRAGIRCISQGRGRVRSTQQRVLADLPAAETLGRWRRASICSRSLIHPTRDAPVHASGNRKWIGVNHSAALLGVLVQTPDEGLATQLLSLWMQEALFKVISLVYLVQLSSVECAAPLN